MIVSRVDPGIYWKPYQTQMRQMAARWAAGEIEDPHKAPFAPAHYWGHVNIGRFIGENFDLGQIPDPEGIQPVETFATAFEAPQDAQRSQAAAIARAAMPRHVNLEQPSGQAMKRRMGLPYRSHSTVDPEKSARFNPSRVRLTQGTADAVLRGKRSPAIYLNSEAAKVFNKALYGDDRGLNGASIPLGTLNYQKTFRQAASSDYANAKILHKIARHIDTAQESGLNSISIVSVGEEYPDWKNTLRHEHMHARQRSLGDIPSGKAGEIMNPALAATFEANPFKESIKRKITSRGYDSAKVGIEVSVWASTDRNNALNITHEEMIETVWRSADDSLRRHGVEATTKLFSTATPSARKLVKSLADIPQESRDKILKSSNTGILSLAKRMAGHVNLESPTGRFLKKILELPYEAHSRVDVLKSAAFLVTGAVRGAFTHLGAAVSREGQDKAFSWVLNRAVTPEIREALHQAETSAEEKLSRLRSRRGRVEADPGTASARESYFRSQSPLQGHYAQFWNAHDALFGVRAGSSWSLPPASFDLIRKHLVAVSSVGILLGSQIVPVARGIRHLLHKTHPQSEEGDETHRVLETPTGKHLKKVLNLPYQDHSIVDPMKSAAFYNGLKGLLKSGLRQEDGFITGSLSLMAHGRLGRESNDVDFVLNRSGRARMRSLGHKPTDHGGWKSFDSGVVEAWDEGGHGVDSAEQDFQSAESLHGWRVQRPSRALELKNRLARPKDRIDLAELGFRPPSGLSQEYATAASGLAVPQHVNLESPTGQHLKRVLGLPYQQHSIIDYTRVTQFFDQLAADNPTLVGKPRAILKTVLGLKMEVYRHFAQGEYGVFSTIARMLLYSEKVERAVDPIFRYHPKRILSRVVRAAAGYERPDFDKVAMEGLEDNPALRRLVFLGGTAFGVAETWLHARHAWHDLHHWAKRMFPGEFDPDARMARALQKRRDREYREARKRGLPYDPTRPGRETRRRKRLSLPDEIVKDIRTQFDPAGQSRSFQDAFRRPKKRAPSLALYGTAAWAVGAAGRRGWLHTAGKAPLERAFGAGGEILDSWALSMQKSAGAYAVAALFQSRTWSGRFGGLANYLATVTADVVGKIAGVRLARTAPGRKAFSSLFSRAAWLMDRLELNAPWARTQRDKWAGYGSALRGEGESVSAEALRAAEGAAGKLGMEAAGIVLEPLILIGMRHVLRKVGQHFDVGAAEARARRAARAGKEPRKRRQSQGRSDDVWLRRYLQTFAAPAYSEKDLWTNPNYRPAVRAALLAARRSGFGAGLDALGRIVTPGRRLIAGLRAVASTKAGHGRREDWSSRLSRTYVAPAYSRADLASNPEYGTRKRVGLTLLSRTAAGRRLLAAASGPTTAVRRLGAWLEALYRPHTAPAHLRRSAGRRLRRAERHAEQTARATVGDPAVDTAVLAGGAIRQVTSGLTAPRHHRRPRVRVKTKVHSHDAALSEKRLHAAYSRYIDYGHEGNTLRTDDSDQ